MHIFLESMFDLIVCFAQKTNTNKTKPNLLLDNRFPDAQEMFAVQTGIKINVFFKSTLKFETHWL